MTDKELNKLLNKFSELSYNKNKKYNEVAGVYNAFLIMLLSDTPTNKEYFINRLQELIEELEQEIQDD